MWTMQEGEMGKIRSAARGACAGAILATALHVWMLYATHLSGMTGEGVAFLTYFGAVMLGAPFNLLLSLAPVPFRLEYPLLLLGIVAKGALLPWIWSRFRHVLIR
jgi:hypothetical protein